MAKKDKSVLKGYFENGKVPPESNFEDLIDSMVSVGEVDQVVPENPTGGNVPSTAAMKEYVDGTVGKKVWELEIKTDVLNVGDNLLNSVGAMYPNSGVVNPALTSYRSSSLIPIDKSTTIKISGFRNPTSFAVVCFFEGNNESSFIADGQIIGRGIGGSNVIDETIIAPTNANYVKFCCYADFVSNAKVSMNSVIGIGKMLDKKIADTKSETGTELDKVKAQNDIFVNSFLKSSKEDYEPLDKDGFALNASPSMSFFTRKDSSVSAPFYPRPYAEWKPVADVSGAFRYVGFSIPNQVRGNVCSYGFWVYNDISSTKNLKIALAGNGAWNSFFDAITNLEIGFKMTKGNATLSVDKIENGWAHIVIDNNDAQNTNPTDTLYVGTTLCSANSSILFSMLIIVLGSQQPYISYDNKSYRGVSNVLKGKKLAWRGDSIMNGLADSSNLNGWLGRIANANSMSYENKAQNGAIMCSKPTINQGLHSIVDNCTDFSMANPDYVILDGGINDYFQSIKPIEQRCCPVGVMADGYTLTAFDTDTYLGALQACFYKLINAYPNAKIGFIIPYKVGTEAGATIYVEGEKPYFDGAKEVCKKWGIPFLDMREKSPLFYALPSMQSKFQDFTHINQLGYDYSLQIIEDWLRSL